MLKHVYKFLILCAVFAGSIFMFSKNIHQVSIVATGSVSMAESTFPLLSLEISGYKLNTMHGYSSNISAREVRESITPLSYDKTFKLYIEENESTIKKLNYEIYSIADNQKLESNSITALDQEGQFKTKTIKLDTTLDTSTEYGMKFTVTNSLGKKIHYYTRIKYYESDFYLKEKMDFVNKFHTQTFKKSDSSFISGCLEPTVDADNSSFSKVTINSSYNMVTWDNLNPDIISEITTTIKEINIETAAFTKDYYASAKTDSGVQVFHVKEFYRVRYSTGHLYMLYFERTLESSFDPSNASLRKSQFLLGITDNPDSSITTSDDNNKLAFVRNGNLWYYDLSTGKLTSIFSFEDDPEDYQRDRYDKHDIQILKMDDEGNIRFVVYGYMNRGDYEGRVAIILYDYSIETNQILERIYIPLTTTYEKLKQDLGSFCYVNDKDIFYFSINNIVYAYNIASKKQTELVSHITDNNFVVIKDTTSFIWMNSDDPASSDKMTIMNLEDENQITLSAGKKDCLTLLGTMDNHIIYGYAHKADISFAANGDAVIPCYKVVISDCQGNILKTYKKKNRYVTSISIDENIIHMARVKKEGNRYIPAAEDSILNQSAEVVNSIDLTTRTTDLTKTEYYITLPENYKMKRITGYETTSNTIVTEDTTLHLDEDRLTQNNYYIYAHGSITSSTQDISDAILLADEQMGVVTDSSSRLVWERGGKFISKSIGGIDTIYTDTDITNTGACVSMLLQSAQVTKSPESLSNGSSFMKLLKQNLDTPVNLTGCTLDEVLYFVSQSCPVIAMKNNHDAVLITAYTTSTITYIDPSVHTTNTVSLTSAETMFENAGSVYLSFLK